MPMTKAQLRAKIRRTFGYPLVKVELTDDQIDDAINTAVQEYIEWSVGQSTQETFFTMMISGGQCYYNLPTGVTEVISVTTESSSSGINTLFTMENYMYNQGMLNLGTAATLVDYHIALDYLETLRKYTPPEFNWKFHVSRNILEIQPVPATGNALQIGDYIYDSPGFMLIRAYMLRGSQIAGVTEDEIYEDLYGDRWVKDYATALCKRTLGYIRRKFAQFQGMGNQNLVLDGDSLVQEAEADLKELIEEVRLTDAWEGCPVVIG